MKSILLASASIFAFAGVAAAEVTFGGEATVGFQDTDSFVNGDDDDTVIDESTDPTFDAADDDYGFYWDVSLDATLSQELDNGLTASATFGIDIDTDTDDIDFNDADYLFSLTSEMGGMYLGETKFAAETYWSSAGDMEADGFSESDGETVLRGEVMFGGVTGGVSYVLADQSGDLVQDGASNKSVDQLSLGVTGEFGMFTFAAAYQDESDFVGRSNRDFDGDGLYPDAGIYDPFDENRDFNTDQVWGLSVGTSFAGADLTVAYAEEKNSGQQSTGIQVKYPFGPVTATAYYVMEDDDSGTDPDDNYGLTIAYVSGPVDATIDFDNDQGVKKLNGDMTYDVGNGLAVIAGFENLADDTSKADGTDWYVGGTFALAEDAELMFAYAEDDNDDDKDQEIGKPELEDGITVEATFTF